MSNDPTYGLVDGSCRLLAVPLLAGQATLSDVVQVVSLEHSFRVEDHRVRNAYQHDASSSIITKVETFRDFTAADSKHYGSLTIHVLVKG